MADDLVKVALRIRPLLKNEIGHNECLQTVANQPQVYVKNHERGSIAFTYNYVFPPSISQEEFYDSAIKGIISNVFKGNFNFLQFIF